MVPGSAPGSTPPEGDLTTSSAEQRTRTFDVVPGGRSGPAGPVPGDVLNNRFVVDRCLADGTTSRLFRALDRRRESAGDADPWVVLKVVTTPPGAEAGGREPRALRALRREAAIAQGLEHPNLPRILGIDHDGPHTFVCSAWVEGESLAAILDSRGTRPMTRVQALHIVDGVGRALTHLHARGIIHADVKPGNILVTAQGNPTLLDFGVALGPGAADLPPARGFTPEYASPEVLAGRDPTPADDLFSLACVAYRMLGGHRAFGAMNAREAAAEGGRPDRPASLSPTQWRALDRALAFARADRQPDIATFLAQLKGVRDESQAVTDMQPPEPEPPGVPAPAVARRIRDLPRAAGLLLVLGSLAGLGVSGWLSRAPAPPAPSATAVPVLPPVPRAADPDPPLVPVPPAPAPAELPAVPSPVNAPPAAASPDRVQPPPPTPGASAADKPRAGASATPAKGPVGPPVPDALGPDSTPMPVPAPAGTPVPGGPLARTAAGSPTVPFSSLKVRRYVEPSYPRNAAARRQPGWVEIAFTVEPSGKTRDVRVLGAEPPGVFEEAAVAAVRRWRFGATAVQGGAADAVGAVNSQVRVRFEPE